MAAFRAPHVGIVNIKITLDVANVNIMRYKYRVKKKASYHHGNLQEELLDAAVALIAEAGVEGFTLREVARRAGVSHNAPYRHFEDKGDLLAAVATQGFERLTASMKRAMAEGDDAESRFRLCGRGYIQFALRWPQHIQVMFDLPKGNTNNEACKEAGDKAFQALLMCIVDLQKDGKLPGGEPLGYAVTAWSMVHGLAKLMIGGQLPFNHTQTLKFVAQTSAVLLAGLQKQPPRI